MQYSIFLVVLCVALLYPVGVAAVRFGGSDGSTFSAGAGILALFAALIPAGMVKQKASVLRAKRITNWTTLSPGIAFFEGPKTTKQFLPFGTQGMTPWDPTSSPGFNDVFLLKNGDETSVGFMDTVVAHFIGTNGVDQKKTRFYWACHKAGHPSGRVYYYVFPSTLTNADIATGISGQYNIYVKEAIKERKWTALHKITQMMIAAGFEAETEIGVNNVPQAFAMWPYGYGYPKFSDDEADAIRADLDTITNAMVKLKEANAKPGVVTKATLDVSKLTFKIFKKT